MGWIGRLLFDGIIVRLYRFYVRTTHGSTPPSANVRRLPDLLTSRAAIHVLVIIGAIVVTTYNVSAQHAVVSSDELVGKTLLSQLVTEGSTDFDQLIEDYPNLDIARWREPQDDMAQGATQPVSIYTNEKPAEASIAASGAVEEPARTEAVNYTVQSGDTISGIARKFGVSVNTILWENSLSATSLIKPGNQLVILPSSGVSHTVSKGETLGQIAKLYGVTADEILKTNSLANANQLRIGAKLIIPGGSKLAAATPSSPTVRKTGAVSAIKNFIKTPAVIPTGAKWVWPTVGHRITQYYSWSHTGLDIANKTGTPIYAAEAGTVESVGYNRGGYGNQIIINHGGGKKTRYAHLSAFDVRTGAKVTKGQYIGAMGSTGRSTGPHLHFEVMINGQRYNPLNYVR